VTSAERRTLLELEQPSVSHLKPIDNHSLVNFFLFSEVSFSEGRQKAFFGGPFLAAN
jgi:hypothetical protein